MSSVGVRLVCFGFLLLVGLSLAPVDGNDLNFDAVNTPSQAFDIRSRLHHLRSPSSSSVLDAHQDDTQALVDVGTSDGITDGNEELDQFGEVVKHFTEEDEDAYNILQQHPVLNPFNPFTQEVRNAMKKNVEQAMMEQLKQASSQRIKDQLQQMMMSSKLNSKPKPKATKPLPKSLPKGKPQVQKNSNQIGRKTIAKPDRSLPTSASIKKKATGKQSSSFLQLDAQLQAEAEAESTIAVGAYPQYSLGAAPLGVVQTIQLLRIGIQADPTPAQANFFNYVEDTAVGLGNAVGRIISASGIVRDQPALASPRQAQQRAIEYCDVLFDPVLPFAGRPNAGRTIQQSGHIIGWALGGSSVYALNFYPQHRSSNNQGGRWGKTEMIALHVAAQCAREGRPGTVSVNIEFDQWDAANQIYPTAGTYNILVDRACVNALTVAGGVGGGCVGGGAAFGYGNAYVRTFCRWSNQLILAGGGPQFDLHYFTRFVNGPGDVIALHPQATRERFFP